MIPRQSIPRKGMRKHTHHVSTQHSSKLGRHHRRSLPFKAVKTRNRMRTKERNIFVNGKVYWRDLKKYHVLKLNKVHATNIRICSWLNNIDKNMVHIINKVHASYVYNCTKYFFQKRYHLN